MPFETTATENRKTFTREYAKETLRRILKTEHVRRFLGIREEDVPKLRAIHEARPILINGVLTLQSSTQYEGLIATLSKLPYNEPYLIVPDQEKFDIFYLLLADGRERKAKKVGETYYLFFENVGAESPEVKQRLSQLNELEHFPQNKIFVEDGKEIVGVEFVFGNYPEKETDVSVFLEECRDIGFGPDTNQTNFKVTTSGKLKYIDGDAMEWVQDPAEHPFTEGSYATRSNIW